MSSFVLNYIQLAQGISPHISTLKIWKLILNFFCPPTIQFRRSSPVHNMRNLIKTYLEQGRLNNKYTLWLFSSQRYTAIWFPATLKIMPRSVQCVQYLHTVVHIFVSAADLVTFSPGSRSDIKIPGSHSSIMGNKIKKNYYFAFEFFKNKVRTGRIR